MTDAERRGCLAAGRDMFCDDLWAWEREGADLDRIAAGDSACDWVEAEVISYLRDLGLQSPDDDARAELTYTARQGYRVAFREWADDFGE